MAKTHNKKLALLVGELKKREQSLESMLNLCFDKQLNLINDPAKLKAALCPRRAGKSYLIGAYLYKEAISQPNVSVIYIAKTHESAKNTMIKDILREINRTNGINAKINEKDLTVKLPNGSIIYLTGVDASADERNKLRGQKFKLAVVDECGSHRHDLRDLITSVLKYCVVDYDGTIVMVGTPSNQLYGMFYDVTRPDIEKRELGWSVHQWKGTDNPYMREALQREYDKDIALNSRIIETPRFKQEALGEWFVDTEKMCFRFDEDLNTVVSIPEQQYKYVLGMDFGFKDPMAFVIAAYAENDPNFYVLETFKKTEMLTHAIVQKIHYFQNKYYPLRIVADPAARHLIEDIKERYGIFIESADKVEKDKHVTMMNSDLHLGTIKLLESKTQDLIMEWKELVWDEKSEKRKPLVGKQGDHLSDATLYAWRAAKNWIASHLIPQTTSLTEQQKVEEFWAMESEKLRSQIEGEWWENV